MLLSLLLPTSLLLTPILAQNTVQSPPFQLIVHSDNATLDGVTLTACHEGAAIESLCLSGAFTPPLAPSVFNFNTSTNNVTFNASLGEPGYLTWVLHGADFNESEPLGLFYNTASNVALPLFYPGDNEAVFVAFDSQDRLNIQQYVDDTVVPAAVQSRAYYRWFVCISYYSGYTYQTLNWVLGSYPPENPTCQKVDVTRKFI